jgi:hypothetical protein
MSLIHQSGILPIWFHPVRRWKRDLKGSIPTKKKKKKRKEFPTLKRTSNKKYSIVVSFIIRRL